MYKLKVCVNEKIYPMDTTFEIHWDINSNERV